MLFLIATLIATTSCTGFKSAPPEPPPPPPKSLEVQIPIVVMPNEGRVTPKKGSTIFIADISGPCSEEVKNALMRRLIDNADYDVLTRDNLQQIFVESEMNWGGKFNTETGAKIGELLSASLFIVGRVVYCGPLVSNSDQEEEQGYSIFAALQLVDIETGKVLLSSPSEGKFIPRQALVYLLDDIDQEFPDPKEVAHSAVASRRKKFSDFLWKATSSGSTTSTDDQAAQRSAASTASKTSQPPAKTKDGGQVKEVSMAGSLKNYPIIKAAESLANGFANNFFSRPTWETALMWTSDEWNYGNSIRYVQLGNCPIAVTLLEEASVEMDKMPPSDIAKYLHNYGVALLCANNPELAMHKLRSSYRIEKSQSTLDMMGLAAKIIEWSLDVEIDTGPEITFLLERNTHQPQAPTTTQPSPEPDAVEPNNQ